MEREKGEGETTGPVTLEHKGAIAYLTLNRPLVGNAIDVPLARALLEAAVTCDIDRAIRCVISVIISGRRGRV